MKKINSLFLSVLFFSFFISGIFSSKAISLVKQVDFLKNIEFGFQKNSGQLTDRLGNPSTDILYFGISGNTALYCYKDKISFVFSLPLQKTGLADKETEHRRSFRTAVSRMELHFKNSNSLVSLTASEPLTQYYTYHRANGRNAIKSACFNKLVYSNIYKNIDLVLNNGPRGLEYSFLVHPGGNAEDIRLQWNGADTIKNIKEGHLRYATGLGYIEESGLKSYTESGNIVGSNFIRKGNNVTFSIKPYDKRKTLTIDPVLEWGTNVGIGSADAVATDAAGNVYLAGSTWTPGLATTGAYKDTIGGSLDAYITKLSKDHKIQWFTYYGSQVDDEVYTMMADSAGNTYMIGNGGVTTPKYDSTFGDIFITKFSSGGELVWSSHFGKKIANGYHSQFDHVAMVLGKHGDFYFTANPFDLDSVSTKGAYQESTRASIPTIIERFDTSGNWKWGTYISGVYNARAVPAAIAADNDNAVYVAGYTDDATLATPGAYLSHAPGNSYDANGFIVKFSEDQQRLWGSLYGGADDEKVTGMVLDDSNNVYITGQTYSDSGIVGGDSVVKIHPLGFFAKISSDGSKLLKGQYVQARDVIKPVYLPASKLIWLFNPNNFAEDKYGNKGALWIGEYDKNCTLRRDRALGGGSPLTITGLVTDGFGNIYLCGNGDNIYVPKGYATENLWKPVGTSVLSEFWQSPCSFVPEIYGSRSVCLNHNVMFKANKENGLSYTWRTSHGTIIYGKNSDSVVIKWSVLKSDTVWLVERLGQCADSISLIPGISGFIFRNANSEICEDDTVAIGVAGMTTDSVRWESFPAGFSSKKIDVRVHPKVTTKYILTINSLDFGCTYVDTFLVKVHPKLLSNFTYKIVDSTYIFTALDTSAVTYAWSFGDGVNDTGKSVSHTYAKNKPYIVSLYEQNKAGCPNVKFDSIINVTISGIGQSLSGKSGIEIYPNPFYNGTTLSYSLEKANEVSVDVIDENGRKFQVLSNQMQGAGHYTLPIMTNGANLSAGIYLIRIIIGNEMVTKPAIKLE